MISKILKRPIFWGIVFTLIGAVAWVASIVINVLTFGQFRGLSNILFIIFAGSFPAGLILELINRFFKK